MLEHFSYRCGLVKESECGLSVKKAHAEIISAAHRVRERL
jgi:hypothetical protein